MACFNVMVILLLTKTGIATLKDYEQEKKMGLDPGLEGEGGNVGIARGWRARPGRAM